MCSWSSGGTSKPEPSAVTSDKESRSTALLVLLTPPVFAVTRINRRRFLSHSSTSLFSLAIAQSLSAKPLNKVREFLAPPGTELARSCWLDVCAPLVIQDAKLGIESEIVLTSDNFIGATGYADGADATEYEIYLYDFQGRLFGDNGTPKHLSVTSMRTTVIPVSDLVGSESNFWGGLRVRLKPKTRIPSHPSDLFSSAFVRWKTKDSFANVHANPDPIQWQRPQSFFYSMPFPPLREYDCVYSLFNPYDSQSDGMLSLYDPFGRKLKDLTYSIQPHSSLLVDLQNGDFAPNLQRCFSCKEPPRRRELSLRGGEQGGTIAVTNPKDSVKNFGYLLIKQSHSPRFTVEHPIHQQPYNPTPATLPFDANGRMRAKNILYTPLVFNRKKIGGVTLESRFHLSSGAPLESALWLSPFITDGEGNVVWQMGPGTVPKSISEKQIERDVIKLAGQQSCILDATQLSLPKSFSGGLSLAISPLSNHTLMKVELRALEWDSPAFTHFRPGLAAARGYQKPQHRSGLATDYIASGARFEVRNKKVSRDEIIAVINIDDKNIAGTPTLEVFASSGLVGQLPLGTIPAFACRHYLLSDLLSGKIPTNDLSLRLVDEKATLLMSVVHLDYDRRDIAADHGSDRFSTFSDYTCDSV